MNNYEEVEPRVRTFAHREEPERIDIIRNRENEYIVVHSDGYDSRTGESEFPVNSKKIKEVYGIDLEKREIPSKEEIISFAETIHPLFKEMLEVKRTAPENLIGRKVIAIRGGFSGSRGGRVMVITEIEGGNISLKNPDNPDPKHLGWGSQLSRCHFDFVFYTPEVEEIIRTKL